jgi:signal transduction histidine kinase
VLAQLERSELIHPEEISLRPFLFELWQTMTPLAERSFELGEVPQGTLLGDPDRLAQALRNLLMNAVKHTAEGDGRVSLSVTPQDGGRLRFVVEDDGPGIPEDQRERVFDRFHRTDPARDRSTGGAGLGLAIVQAIARAHAGTITAGEASGGGARLTMVLPGFTARAEEHAAETPVRAEGPAEIHSA